MRLFDRYGERSNRAKARLKYLVADWGIEGLKSRIDEIRLSLTNQTFEMTEDVPRNTVVQIQITKLLLKH